MTVYKYIPYDAGFHGPQNASPRLPQMGVVAPSCHVEQTEYDDRRVMQRERKDVISRNFYWGIELTLAATKCIDSTRSDRAYLIWGGPPGSRRGPRHL